MKFSEVVAQTLAWLQREGRVSYRALRLEFDLTEDVLDALKEELIEIKELAVDKDGKMLVWVGQSSPESRVQSLESNGQSLASRVQGLESEKQGLIVTGQTLDPRLNDSRLSDARRQTLDARHEGERRQLTVMFCDLVGSTSLSEQLDPEEYREVVRAYQETCEAVIQRYDGRLAQYLGDGILVYFGYPAAHEDDAQRAVRAALEIIPAIQEKVPSPTRGEGQGEGALGKARQLQVRIGIHTGPVVVGEIGGGERREMLALGETPNVTARLQGIAEPDTLLISAATQRLLLGLFDCQDLGRQELKGISAPLQVYRVLSESRAQSRLEVDVSTGKLTPLVGRANEVGLILERWAAAQAGDGQVVLVSGEPGIGKSRLVQEVKERLVQQNAICLEFRCSPYSQNSAFFPVLSHLQRLLQFERNDLPQDKLAKLQQRLTRYHFPQPDTLSLLAGLLSLPHPENAPALTLSPQKQKQKTQEALVAWISEEAERQPVYCVWEDLHWVDPSTLELLGLLLDQVPTVRMLVLLTARPEFIPPWSSRAHLIPLSLARLPRTQAGEMIAKVTGGKPLPAEVQQQIVSKTDGVPLFVEELTKSVVESVGVPGRSPLQLGIPATLQDALMARLDRLGSAKEIAQLGATLGREFSHELLHAVSSLDEVAIKGGLAKLVEAEVLYQRGLPPQARYIFKHALIQDAAYQSLLKSRRQQLHQQIAQVVEQRFAEIKEIQPELLAHHYTEAGIKEQAIPYWQKAGQRATQRSANTEAVSHLTKALELLQTLSDMPERAQQELTLQLILGPALMTAKSISHPDVERTYNRARELCQQIGETSQLFPALWGLRRFYSMRAEYKTTQELEVQLLRLAQSVQDPALLLEAQFGRGLTSFWLGELIIARECFAQSLALYDPQQHHSHAFLYGSDPGVASHSYNALTLWHLGYPAQALQESRRGLVLAQELTHPFSRVYALSCVAWVHHLRREAQATEEQIEIAIRLATEQGFPFWVAWGSVLRGWALSMQGQRENGIAQMRQGIATHQALSAEMGRTWFFAMLADAYEMRGQSEEGLHTLTEAIDAVNKRGEGAYEAELYRLRGELTLAQSSVQGLASRVQEEVEECFLKAIEIAQHQQAKSLELRATMSLARLWRQQGKRIEAHQMLSEVYNWFMEGFDTKDLQEAKALLEDLGEKAKRGNGETDERKTG